MLRVWSELLKGAERQVYGKGKAGKGGRRNEGRGGVKEVVGEGEGGTKGMDGEMKIETEEKA